MGNRKHVLVARDEFALGSVELNAALRQIKPGNIRVFDIGPDAGGTSAPRIVGRRAAGGGSGRRSSDGFLHLLERVGRWNFHFDKIRVAHRRLDLDDPVADVVSIVRAAENQIENFRKRLLIDRQTDRREILRIRDAFREDDVESASRRVIASRQFVQSVDRSLQIGVAERNRNENAIHLELNRILVRVFFGRFRLDGERARHAPRVAGGVQQRRPCDFVFVFRGIGENVANAEFRRFRFEIVRIEQKYVVVITERAAVITVEVKRARLREQLYGFFLVAFERRVQLVRIVGVRRFAPIVEVRFQTEVKTMFFAENVFNVFQTTFRFRRRTADDRVFVMRTENLSADEIDVVALFRRGRKIGKGFPRFCNGSLRFGEAMPLQVSPRFVEITFRPQNVGAVAQTGVGDHVFGERGVVDVVLTFDRALTDKGNLIAERHGSDVVRKRAFRFAQQRERFRRASLGNIAVGFEKRVIDFFEDVGITFHDPFERSRFRIGSRGSVRSRGSVGTGGSVVESGVFLSVRESGGRGDAGCDRRGNED